MLEVHLAGQHPVRTKAELAGQGAAELATAEPPVGGDGGEEGGLALSVDPAQELGIAGLRSKAGEGRLGVAQTLHQGEGLGHLGDDRPALGLAPWGGGLLISRLWIR